MCGVIGYIGQKSCVDIIYNGLEKLEYRGYDSAGIAVFDESNKSIKLAKVEGKLAKLKPLLTSLPQGAKKGIGHTRWATHGSPSAENAHPHGDEKVAVIHNGIIENYREIKDELVLKGYKFQSETDTEVVVHFLIDSLEQRLSPLEAMRLLVKKLEGAYALGVLFSCDPDAIYVVKQGSPLVVGLGDDENFFASDALALFQYTKKVVFLNDGEMARLASNSVAYWDFSGKPLQHSSMQLDFVLGSSEKQGFKHFMIKEIHEQPSVLANTVSRLVDLKSECFNFDALGLSDLEKHVDLKSLESVNVVACGTAFHAGMMAKYLLEPMCQIPVNVELASEFRYRAPHFKRNSLLIAFSQSGETADTLASVKHALQQGAKVLSICNVHHASIPRASHATLYMEAGPEIGVASTKAFTSMLLCLYLFTLGFAEKRGDIDKEKLKQKLMSLKMLPFYAEKTISVAGLVKELAEKFYETDHCLFIGRGVHYPISLEGALKLKEISYIHAEGYAGGELKHGPIALVDRHMPIVALVPKDIYYEKMASNVEEVRARGGRVIIVGHDSQPQSGLDYVKVPYIDEPLLQAIISTIPLQLFSYYVAVRRGTDVDQPRNLAKSVTVE